MREKLAKAMAALTVVGLVGLSVFFAEAQNPRSATAVDGDRAQESQVQEVTPVDTVRARALFAELGCDGCHTVGGEGNPRNPLDGIGSRRTAASIRAWTVGEGSASDSLSRPVLRMKAGYADLPAADLEVLIRWLSGLKDGT